MDEEGVDEVDVLHLCWVGNRCSAQNCCEHVYRDRVSALSPRYLEDATETHWTPYWGYQHLIALHSPTSG